MNNSDQRSPLGTHSIAILGLLVCVGCDPSVVTRAGDMIEIARKPAELMVECGPSKTEAQCAVATGPAGGEADPELVARSREALAKIEETHGSFESVDLDVYAPPTPEEDSPGMATGIATFGDAEYRFHMYWEKVGGDLVLTNWSMTKSD